MVVSISPIELPKVLNVGVKLQDVGVPLILVCYFPIQNRFYGFWYLDLKSKRKKSVFRWDVTYLQAQGNLLLEITGLEIFSFLSRKHCLLNMNSPFNHQDKSKYFSKSFSILFLRISDFRFLGIYRVLYSASLVFSFSLGRSCC